MVWVWVGMGQWGDGGLSLRHVEFLVQVGLIQKKAGM